MKSLNQKALWPHNKKGDTDGDRPPVTLTLNEIVKKQLAEDKKKRNS